VADLRPYRQFSAAERHSSNRSRATSATPGRATLAIGRLSGSRRFGRIFARPSALSPARRFAYRNFRSALPVAPVMQVARKHAFRAHVLGGAIATCLSPRACGRSTVNGGAGLVGSSVGRLKTPVPCSQSISPLRARAVLRRHIRSAAGWSQNSPCHSKLDADQGCRGRVSAFV